MRAPTTSLVLLALVSAGLAGALQAGPSAYAGATWSQARSTERGVKHVYVPKAARAVGTRHPDHVVGHGTPASCTSRAVVRAVARGGVVTFDCGPDPVVIRMRHPAKVVNTSRRVVLDGGGLVTLSGRDRHRILYLNACDPQQGLRVRDCQTSGHPRLVVQHLTLTHGNSSGDLAYGGGGGAILAYGGQLKVVDSTFLGNRCDRTGPDLGGGAVRARFQPDPVYVVHSTFRGGRCSNGAALSGLNVSFTVLNSRFSWNKAIGHGANPARPHTPGGGSGGAIYTDGEDYTVRIGGTSMRHNHANEGGGAIFYVSNDRSGTLHIRWSTLEDNVSDRFWTRPGIFYLGHGPIDLESSIVR
ncbi:MAG TPA: hypothetical protein VFI21_04140 [Nocardioides sp.]|nr:hypothetical protein [Nocardioides sp.]